jgi:hypothetical protein
MTPLLLSLLMVAAAERPMVEAELTGQCETEHIAVYSSGVAHFDISNCCGTSLEDFRSGLRQIGDKQLESLKSAIAAARFASLPDRIEPDPSVVSTEEDIYRLRVWRNGVAKEVRAFGLERAVDQEAARRFESVWAAVEQFGPEAK